ncbi:DUF1772 domain-containing protein [Micromonospora sp. KC213]|uniref:DUF1772 domain-containing protein n=1 Tax=Micromonospora sp. KC213 TaxID=2530378 RepID=UPI00104B200F|nr:DUF1772 domain-containing protein [Micromonospora sp. KC213]TDC42441.1 DUF1772 domain-containing protein [Micromonospora sp. KC213]
MSHNPLSPAPSRVASVLLWLLVVFVGVQFGAGLYEKIVVVPLWDSVPPRDILTAMQQSGMYDAGRAFWPFVSPVVALLAIANIAAWRANRANRRWVLAAGIIMLSYAIFSYSYFVPQMLMLQSSADSWSESRISTTVQWWTSLNYLRMFLGAAGWFCALRALSLAAAGNRSAS